MINMKNHLTVVLLVGIFPGLAQALGLGDIQTDSYLGQPFKARIEIVSASVPELDSLTVILGDDAAFERSGLDRRHELNQMQFKIIETDTGKHYIEVSIKDPIREPILNFILEAFWPGGHIIRTYTALLDPPYYAAVEHRRKIAKAETPPPPEVPDTAVEPAPQLSMELPSSRAADTAIAAAPGDWTVSAGDTLYAIAGRMRPDNTLSVEQMMLALLRANPDAFIDGNINNVRRGATLTMPVIADIQSISRENAASEVRAQNRQWKNIPVAAADAGEPGLIILAPDAATPEFGNIASGPPTEGAGEIGAIKQQLDIANETIESYKSENVELEKRLSAAEAMIADLKSELETGLKVETAVAVPSRKSAGDYGPTVTGDNLWTIANQVRPDPSLRINQVMLAILLANPDAFILGNINGLKRNVTLQIPDLQAIQSIDKREAAEQVREHNTAWEAR